MSGQDVVLGVRNGVGMGNKLDLGMQWNLANKVMLDVEIGAVVKVNLNRTCKHGNYN